MAWGAPYILFFLLLPITTSLSERRYNGLLTIKIIMHSWAIIKSDSFHFCSAFHVLFIFIFIYLYLVRLQGSCKSPQWSARKRGWTRAQSGSAPSRHHCYYYSRDCFLDCCFDWFQLEPKEPQRHQLLRSRSLPAKQKTRIHLSIWVLKKFDL